MHSKEKSNQHLTRERDFDFCPSQIKDPYQAYPHLPDGSMHVHVFFFFFVLCMDIHADNDECIPCMIPGKGVDV